jgi:hypothetical protein
MTARRAHGSRAQSWPAAREVPRRHRSTRPSRSPGNQAVLLKDRATARRSKEAENDRGRLHPSSSHGNGARLIQGPLPAKDDARTLAHSLHRTPRIRSRTSVGVTRQRDALGLQQLAQSTTGHDACTCRSAGRPRFRSGHPDRIGGPMSITSILIVVLVVLFLGGGGFYWSRR